MGEGHRVLVAREHLARHQTGEVGHVHPQLRTDLVGDLTEGLEIQVPRVGRPASDDHGGALLESHLAHLIHIEPVRLFIHAVGDNLVVLTGEVELHAVREVPAMVQLEAHDLVTQIG